MGADTDNPMIDERFELSSCDDAHIDDRLKWEQSRPAPNHGHIPAGQPDEYSIWRLADTKRHPQKLAHDRSRAPLLASGNLYVPGDSVGHGNLQFWPKVRYGPGLLSLFHTNSFSLLTNYLCATFSPLLQAKCLPFREGDEMRRTEAYFDDRWDEMHSIDTDISSQLRKIRHRRTHDSQLAHRRRSATRNQRGGWGPYPHR